MRLYGVEATRVDMTVLLLVVLRGDVVVVHDLRYLHLYQGMLHLPQRDGFVAQRCKLVAGMFLIYFS